MNLSKFNEVTALRDKRELLEHLLNRLNGDGNPRVGVSYFSDLFDEILSITLHDDNDLQKELNAYVKDWILNKLKDIEKQIEEL